MSPSVESHTLYRKYRPSSFDQVLGQNEVIDVLKKSIQSGSIAHAYLFSGGRGTGKTSIARIFARELGTSDQDLYEIDAASNRGINEIRELRDGVSTLPFDSPYKVYIIDEVHMLTKEAFNALLKTLEEPPSHVLFILATTEKHKVLDTILSRCEVHDFRKPIIGTLVELVLRVCKEEKRTIDEQSALFVARLGNGSFRDTLSYLQKIFSYFDTDIQFDELQSVFGQNNRVLTVSLLQAISNKDSDELFAVYQSLLSADVDIKMLVEDLLELVRTVLLLRYSNVSQGALKNTLSEEEYAQLSDMPGITSHVLRDLLNCYERVLQSSRPRESFELFLFELS